MKRSSRKTADSPQVYIIAGPNGAGKTTFARVLLPEFLDCYEFVNADYLAQGLSPLLPDRAAIKAGRLMLSRIDELARSKQTFGFETTFSGRTYVNLIKRLKALGYKVHISFLWLPKVTYALERVSQRVEKGGHNIPEPVVRRRFKAGLRNFLNLYSELADSWILWDASKSPPLRIADKIERKVRVHDSVKYGRLKEL